jgi:hypothetical protein
VRLATQGGGGMTDIRITKSIENRYPVLIHGGMRGLLSVAYFGALVGVAGSASSYASPPANSSRPLRAVWIDDIPSLTLSNENSTPTAFQRGDVTIFPGRWPTALGDIPPGRDLRFRLNADGIVYGTMGDFTDWLATPPILLTGYPYLDAVWWKAQLPNGADTTSSERHILDLGAGDHGWTILTAINGEGCACGATATSTTVDSLPETLRWAQ